MSPAEILQVGGGHQLTQDKVGVTVRLGDVLGSVLHMTVIQRQDGGKIHQGDSASSYMKLVPHLPVQVLGEESS